MEESKQNQEWSPGFGSILTAAVGVGMLIGWRWARPGGTSTSVTKWTDWLTPRYKLVLVVRGDIPKLNRAKLATDCASASILAFKTSRRQTPLSSLFWTITGQPKVVVRANSAEEFTRLCQEASKRRLCTSLIREKSSKQTPDEDKVESLVLAVGPGPSRLLDQITGNLKLF